MNPTHTTAWKQLQSLYDAHQHTHLTTYFAQDADRFTRFSIENDYVLFDYSKQRINASIMETLMAFAREQQIEAERKAFFAGEKINRTEDRAVLHTALRRPKSDRVMVDGADVMPDVYKELAAMEAFCERVISGAFTGFSGKPITDIVNIGIGGSDLGPKMVVNALRDVRNHLHVHFVSNVDKAAIDEVWKQIDPETTLFVIVSKTFTTIETLTNAETAREALIRYYGDEKAVAHHFVAVSTNVAEVVRFGIDKEHIFSFWDWVGGRYSLWSSVGLSIALAVGFPAFRSLLDGACQADRHFEQAPLEQNIPVIMALLDVWNGNFHQWSSRAVIPYSDALALFPAFLQQLDMESNGKAVDRDGQPVNYATSSVLWGEPGTDGQHSFFQLLHQGTDIIPIDFIGIRPAGNRNVHDVILQHNLIAQSKALMEGSSAPATSADPYAAHKAFTGNRPSTTLLLKGLSPSTLGYLIALYEHKVFTLGVLWNVFSFDQWGVQLGKKVALSLDNPTEADKAGWDSSTRGLYAFLQS